MNQTNATAADQQQLERQSLQILATAAQAYLDKQQDDLGRTFVTPQIQGAINHINALINRHYTPPVSTEPAPVADAPAAGDNAEAAAS